MGMPRMRFQRHSCPRAESDGYDQQPLRHGRSRTRLRHTRKLNWFIAEQVEEEETARELIDKFTLIGNDGMGLYMLDQELAARTYNVPSPLATAE